MAREDRWLMIVFICALILALCGLWFEAYAVHAQDVPTPSVCQQADNPTQFVFHIPPEWNNPDLPSWWALGDGYSMVDDTTIVVDALTQVESYGEGFPQWEQDLHPGQALVGSWDYATILVGDEKTAVCGDVATTIPPTEQNAANGQVSRNQPIAVGRTCVVKYPQIVLVCNG